MGTTSGFKKQGRSFCIVAVCAAIVFPSASTAVAGDMMSTICKNQVVSVGDRKGVVLTKCGPPLSKSQDTADTRTIQTSQKKKSDKKQGNKEKVTVKKKTVKERAETWAYNIDGSYRFFIFKEGKLDELVKSRFHPSTGSG